MALSLLKMGRSSLNDIKISEISLRCCAAARLLSHHSLADSGHERGHPLVAAPCLCLGSFISAIQNIWS